MNIKRIVILTQNYFPLIGGITTWCYEYAGALSRQGYEVLVIAPGADELPPDPPAAFEVRRLDHRHWKNRKNILVYKEIAPLIEPETLFLCANWKLAVPCMMHSFLRRIFYITAVHGLDAFERRRLNRRIQTQSLRRSAAVIPVSSYTKELLSPLGIEPQKMRVINNGVDLAKFPAGPPDPAILASYGFGDNFRILSLGRLDKRKGFDTTIRALQYLDDNAHYYLAGTGGYKGELERIADETGVRDRVHFLGFIPDSELADVYKCADIFSMPARRVGRSVEGFGIVYLEAAACGVASIAGKNSGGEDAVVDGQSGYLVDPESPQALADALRDAMDNPERLRRLGASARQRTEASFTWDHLAGELMALAAERRKA